MSDQFDLAQISARLRDHERALICIDGPAGAGKTTLATAFVETLADVHVIHMDDLYAGWTDALSADLTERLVTQIRDPFLGGSAVRYRRYDWYASAFAEFVEVPATRLLIVEGVGAAQAVMRDAAAVSVFVDVEPAVGRERVIARDGDVSASHIDAWQVHERAHFARDRTRESVHYVLPRP